VSGGVWLVRHGALPPNPERRMVGARDIPLSDVGRQQVRALARQFMPQLRGGLRAVICSDLDRCRETAALLLEGLLENAPRRGGEEAEIPPLFVEPGLREICLGRWQGMTKAEIERAWPGAWAARGRDMACFCPPEGESFAQAQRRGLAAVARWRKRCPEGTLLVVAHAGILGSLLAHYMALPLRDVLLVPQHYACRAFVPEW